MNNNNAINNKAYKGIRVSSFMTTIIFWHHAINAHNARMVVKSFNRKYKMGFKKPMIEIAIDGGCWHG